MAWLVRAVADAASLLLPGMPLPPPPPVPRGQLVADDLRAVPLPPRGPLPPPVLPGKQVALSFLLSSAGSDVHLPPPPPTGYDASGGPPPLLQRPQLPLPCGYDSADAATGYDFADAPTGYDASDGPAPSPPRSPLPLLTLPDK